MSKKSNPIKINFLKNGFYQFYFKKNYWNA